VDAPDTAGRTALHIAAALGWADGVAALLEAGADINATDAAELPALAIAAERYRSPRVWLGSVSEACGGSNHVDVLRVLLARPDLATVVAVFEYNRGGCACYRPLSRCLASSRCVAQRHRQSVVDLAVQRRAYDAALVLLESGRFKLDAGTVRAVTKFGCVSHRCC
jgi:hypothetical protein